MYLTDYNLNKILENYNSIPEFLKEIERVVGYIKEQPLKNMVLAMGIYYKNLNLFKNDMTDDVLNLKDLAISSFKSLEVLYIKYEFELFKFLSDLIIFNTSYVSNIRRLA